MGGLRLVPPLCREMGGFRTADVIFGSLVTRNTMAQFDQRIKKLMYYFSFIFLTKIKERMNFLPKTKEKTNNPS